MARYIAEDKEFTKTLQSRIVEEEINRRLKAAGLYDDEDTYETRKQIDEVLQKSKEESVNGTKLNLASWKPTTSFENSFNIVDDDEDIMTDVSPRIGTSAKKNGRKPAEWKSLSGDEYDDDDFQTINKWKAQSPLEGTSNYVEKNYLNPQKGKYVGVKKLSLTAKASYGNKMVAASLKKGEENKTLGTICPLREKRGDLIITPDELSDIEDVPEIESRKVDTSRSSPKDADTTEKSFDSENDDFLAVTRHKNNQNRGKLDPPASESKTKIGTMKMLFTKYSEMLAKIEQIPALPLPEELDFESKGPYQQLIENEEQSKIAQQSCSRPIRWKKPIILTVSNNRKRRQIIKKSATSDICPPVDTKIDRQDDIICDSPPAYSSTAKLDVPPTSPVFESGASRKRMGGSKEITEIGKEIDRKPPVDTIQDSSFQECPICGKSFPRSVIETHADGCINNIQEEARPRSERIAARSVKSRNGLHDSSQWGKGMEPVAGSSNPTKPEMDMSEEIFDSSNSDSDFEAMNGSGTKRNQRKIESGKVKKRRF